MQTESSPEVEAGCAIAVDHLSKQFRVHHKGTLKRAILGVLPPKSALQRAIQGLRRKKAREKEAAEAATEPAPLKERMEDLPALNDVSFQIPHGQTVAVIGRNGSGKSTLLGILARVYRPTSGEIHLYGPNGGKARIAPLLELGAGFHPELDGLENIEFYGAVLGLSAQEIREQTAQIVEFAELEGKIDTVLRGWNDGAKLRLGFSIAIHTNPDILLVDEVLAVGDESFQNKCYRRIAELQAQGKTILFVSHDLAVVERVANRIIWLHQGVIRRDGDVPTVLRAYREASARTE